MFGFDSLISWMDAILLMTALVDVVFFVKNIKFRIDIHWANMKNATEETYLCGYSLADMIEADFPDRFGGINDNGFCYLWSAVAMLAFRRFKQTRLVRGQIDLPDYKSKHSWVEIRIYGRWWVFDLMNRRAIFMPRRFYYKHMRPEILITYDYQEFWSDPLAVKFYERLRKPETSRILVEIWRHYTPSTDGIEIGEPEVGLSEITLPDWPRYTLFPKSLGHKFSQELVDELMGEKTCAQATT